MPSIVYQYVKGRKYAYSSESYWDKEKKAPRAHLTYLGAVDEETGEIIPSKKRRKEQQKLEAEKVARCPGTDSQEKLSAMIAENEQLKKRIEDLESKCLHYQETMNTLSEIIVKANDASTGTSAEGSHSGGN